MVRLTMVRKTVRSLSVTFITSVVDSPRDDPTRSGSAERSQSTRYPLSEKVKDVDPQSIGLKSALAADVHRTASAASDAVRIIRIFALFCGRCEAGSPEARCAIP